MLDTPSDAQGPEPVDENVEPEEIIVEVTPEDDQDGLALDNG